MNRRDVVVVVCCLHLFSIIHPTLESIFFIIFADDPFVYLVSPGDVMESKASSSDNHEAFTGLGSSSGEDLH